MSERPEQTLGQKIDALLEPLYAEADQHRAAIEQATQQQQALQAQVDTATQALGQIETRMAEVVRNLAQQDKVMAAVVGQAKTPADTSATPEPAVEEAAAPPVDEAVSQIEAVGKDEFNEPEPEIELDPEKDAEAVNTASALLNGSPAAGEDEAETEVQAEAPKPDLTAVAERAAEAARKLRAKAATE